ncbi:T9SS type A sorting domain-containing protein [Chitinophaga sp.]|uniref:T9SS type A sorting domain-containing protein n=1 Tax=Chitinophaga sp. TaxID=1869181 RepID=UPI0031D5A4E8
MKYYLLCCILLLMAILSVHAQDTIPPAPVGSTIYLLNDVWLMSAADRYGPMKCDHTTISASEQFVIVDAGDSTIALQGSNGRYVTSTSPMRCTSTLIDHNSRFKWVGLGTNTVALQNLKGEFVFMESNLLSLNCNAKEISTGTTFTWSAVSVSPQDEKSASADLTVFPNPASGNVNIRYELPAAAEVLIEFYNSRGTLVKSFLGGLQEGTTRLNIGISDLEAGMYLVRLTSKGIRETKKLIVQ